MGKASVLYFDEGGYNKEVGDIERAADCLQPLLDEALSLNVFSVTTIKELQDLVSGGVAYCKERIASQLTPVVIGGFTMKVSAMIDTLDLPSFNKLESIISNCKSVMAESGHRCYIYLSIKEKKIEINAWELDTLKDSYSILADNKERQKLHNDIDATVRDMQSLHNTLLSFGTIGITPDTRFSDLFIIEKNKVIMNQYYLQKNKHLFNA